MPAPDIIRAFLRRDDVPLTDEALLPVAKAPARAARSASAAETDKKVAVRLLKDATDPEAPLSGPAVRWARKVLQDIIARHPAPVAKAIPHADRRPAPEPGTVASVFHAAVRRVPSRGSHSTLSAAFEDERERRQHGRYGTPINPPEKATGPPTA